MPQTYLRYREYIEQHFHHRPTVGSCAKELGYSTRTLDRACQVAVGRSAKTVLDERVAIEIKRLLTLTDAPINRIAAAFEFDDPSSFAKYVHRHLGDSPTQIRSKSSARV